MSDTAITPQKTLQLTPLQQNLIQYLFTEKDIKTAAKKAGYSESSSLSTVYSLLRKPHIHDKILEHYKAINASNIPKLAQIESKIFKKVLANPGKYKEFKDVFKQAKQHAGLLSDDTAPRPATVNIAHIEKVQVAIGDMLSKRLQGTDNEHD